MMPVSSQIQFTSLKNPSWVPNPYEALTQRLIRLFLEPRKPRCGCCLGATQRTG